MLVKENDIGTVVLSPKVQRTEIFAAPSVAKQKAGENLHRKFLGAHSIVPQKGFDPAPHHQYR